LARGDKGVNPLDDACQEHDISYSKSKNLQDRHIADKVLGDKAWERVKAKNSKFGERIAALGVAGAMKAKVKLGMGLKKKARKRRTPKKGSGHGPKLVKLKKKSRRITIPSTVKLHHGGFLPLLFAGLSALAALAGGGSSIASAVNKAKNDSKTLDELKKHNAVMEAAAIGSKGSGLYLKPYVKGKGLYLKPYVTKN